MASIIKRKKNYSVVYSYIDENGEKKQKWETRSSYQDALKRKAEIESKKTSGTFLPPSDQTIKEFLLDFVSLYGEKRWGVSMYDSQNSLIANYINPIIGDMKVQDITPRVVDKYIQTLQKTPPVATKTHRPKSEYMSNQNIEKIIKLLRCAFKQAVRWEIVPKNPFDNVVLPKTEYKKRDIWTAEIIRKALDSCTESKLYIAMNLAFACSMRIGEILGLTWNNVHIEDEDIATDNAYVYIDKELVRASKRAIEMLGKRDIYHIFPPLFANTSTRVVLKKPKPYKIIDAPETPIVSEPREKYLISGKNIRIAHEIVSVLGEDGKTMRTESVQSFAKKQLLRHYQTLDDFIQTWTEAERKQAIMDELKEYAILIDAVREANPALKDADIFDVICHVAFDQPPLTRKERANNVKKRNYFGKYEGKAREVLEALLDKYAENGILDFEKANILEIPPFNSIGKPTKIIKLFGGKVAFEQAIRELEYQIYKSA